MKIDTIVLKMSGAAALIIAAVSVHEVACSAAVAAKTEADATAQLLTAQAEAVHLQSSMSAVVFQLQFTPAETKGDDA